MKKKKSPVVPYGLRDLPNAQLERAAAEDRTVKQILRKALTRPTRPMATEKSIRDGERFMERMRQGSRVALLSRITRGELITREALILRLGGDSRWLNTALKAERVFSLPTPSGIEFFPSFFADASYDRRALGKVAQALAGLPGPSKYYFFTTKSFTLGTTPLRALAEGRAKDVLRCAVGFSER